MSHSKCHAFQMDAWILQRMPFCLGSCLLDFVEKEQEEKCYLLIGTSSKADFCKHPAAASKTSCDHLAEEEGWVCSTPPSFKSSNCSFTNESHIHDHFLWVDLTIFRGTSFVRVDEIPKSSKPDCTGYCFPKAHKTALLWKNISKNKDVEQKNCPFFIQILLPLQNASESNLGLLSSIMAELWILIMFLSSSWSTCTAFLGDTPLWLGKSNNWKEADSYLDVIFLITLTWHFQGTSFYRMPPPCLSWV